MTFPPLCRCEQWWVAAWHGLLYSVVNTTEESRGGIQRERSFIELLLYIRPITKWLGVWLCHQRDLALSSKPKCAHSKMGIMVAPYPMNTSSVLSKHHYKIDDHHQVFLNIMWVESHVPHVVCAKLLQLCPILCDPTDHKAPLSGLSRQEYWNALPLPSSRGSSESRDRTCVSFISCIGRQVLYP